MLGTGVDLLRTAMGRARPMRPRLVPLPLPPPGCGWVYLTDQSGAHRPVTVTDGEGRLRPVYAELPHD